MIKNILKKLKPQPTEAMWCVTLTIMNMTTWHVWRPQSTWMFYFSLLLYPLFYVFSKLFLNKIHQNKR
ncbi:hypothetical protein COV24_03575 [candidate division WWE3 bacterium CG10_big_fil_rev_8_21_14_0_10_32_10]|uniref:Uncharacterized protein n=1 Tax=candidate division WWE3 bacterium CG10_big_fil_rev_8_21_14_0_10_32_10 TaxID=1975090 RepID=A0A2H0R9U6_UNCKA|nr:MAG: hypothetical protein COV24_03575 [candidate division WWE3 bacterium CG10_big_fil_rev_8_21_14_0_10_32_10]